MNIQIDELPVGDKQTVAIAYLTMLQPMMQNCTLVKQNSQFDFIYRRLASGRKFDRNDLLKKIAELTLEEDEKANHYGKQIIKIIGFAVEVFGNQPDAAFRMLIEELSKFIALLNDTITSLEDIVEKKMAIVKRLEEKQEQLGKYINVQVMKGEDRPNTYEIQSDLGKLFQEATEKIIKILAERGTVNKQAYVDQVVFGVQRILKIPTEALALQIRQEKTTTPDMPKVDDTSVKEGDADVIPADIFEGMDKETFFTIIKNLAKGPASDARMQESGYYEKLCKQQAQYKFTKAQQKQLTSWLQKVEKLLTNAIVHRD